MCGLRIYPQRPSLFRVADCQSLRFVILSSVVDVVVVVVEERHKSLLIPILLQTL